MMYLETIQTLLSDQSQVPECGGVKAGGILNM